MAEIKVKSEVSGMICAVLVKEGDAVAEFDPLVLVESMKMEIPVTAPRAGTVVTIFFAQGETVSEGDVAVTLAT